MDGEIFVGPGAPAYTGPAPTQTGHKEPQLCFRFLEPGGCQAGDKCKFIHCNLKHVAWALNHAKGAPKLDLNGPPLGPK